MMPVECEHGHVVDWGDFGPDPDAPYGGATPCEQCPPDDWFSDHDLGPSPALADELTRERRRSQQLGAWLGELRSMSTVGFSIANRSNWASRNILSVRGFPLSFTCAKA
ncbi:MAG: hypothetical protein ACPGNP_12630, partial [Acidimicrobiales bacterium]